MDKLAKFMNDTFTGWRSVNLNGLERLVVDGDSVCAQLYRQLDCGPGSWLLGGGEYSHFHTKTREFFAEVLFTGVQLIVILNGVETLDHDGVRSVCSRNTQINESMRRAQGRMGWKQSTDEDSVLPLLIGNVFVDVVQSLGVQLRVADGSSAREVAAYANHYKCPVLGANSEFFIFELEHGYIPLRNLSTVIANGLMFQVGELQRQFWLKDSKSRLVIPALYGNSSIKGAKTGACDFENDLKEISAHETIEEYLASKEAEKELRDNFEAAIKYYCDVPLPSDHDDPELVSYTGPFSNLPKWILCSFRLGRYQPQLLNALIANTYVLRTVIEDIKGDSAWLTSRPIRQHLYGFMGIPLSAKVNEVIRARSSPEVGNSYVSPCNFEPPIQFRDFVDNSEEELANVVMKVLKCDMISQDDIEQDFNTLSDKWKLPIAATFYWYHTCDNPPAQRHLVKSLLLSFMTCSKELKADDLPPLEPVSRETKSDHLMALHAFAQWQCVYYDALSLNYLAREPFPPTSPACLYSGEVVMFYASFARKNLRMDCVFQDSSERSLFNKFLYLVTGCDDEERRGRHAKYQPKPKTLPAVNAPSKLQETNRFTLLSDSEDI